MKVLCSLLVITQTARGFIKTAGVRAPLQLNTATIDAPVTPTPSIFVDTDKLLAESSFPLSSDEMIDLSKTFLLSRGGLGADPELLASSFQFEGPVVGPLSKDAFTKALGSVDFDAAFPDFQGEFYGFHVDPFEGNRVGRRAGWIVFDGSRRRRGCELDRTRERVAATPRPRAGYSVETTSRGDAAAV